MENIKELFCKFSGKKIRCIYGKGIVCGYNENENMLIVAAKKVENMLPWDNKGINDVFINNTNNSLGYWYVSEYSIK